MENRPGDPIKIFYCYAREDHLLREELEKHLTPLKRSGKIVTWCDRELLPGTEWEHAVSLELNTADLVLVLVSADFICSDYCYGIEMKRAYERHTAGEAWVLPIIIRPVLWKGTIISQFQVLPAEGKPVTTWVNPDEAFENIAQGINRAVETLLTQRTKQEQQQNMQNRKRYPTLYPLSKEQYHHFQDKALKIRTLLQRRYIIQKIIGKGNMGGVYRAEDLKYRNISCAIKELIPSMLPAEEQTQAIHNFKLEAKILWCLNHPNLPAFANFFVENNRYYIVMEYIEGKTLDCYIETQTSIFTEQQVLRWAKQLCDVLHYLHSQNPPIIFRDLKPGNIMLTHQDHIKLINFGIARYFRESSRTDTQQLGTPGFAPPEQYGQAQTDERSDIYSLALTLFQLLTNTLPTKGFGLKHVYSFTPRISPMVAQALEKAASPNPDDRYQNIADFRKALLKQ